MRILSLQLLNVELVGLYDILVDVAVVFYHSDFHLINLISIEFYLTLQFLIQLIELVSL